MIDQEQSRKEKLRERIMQRWEDLKREKNPWNLMYDYISQYVMMREGNFAASADTTDTYHDYATFTPDLVFDSTAPRANYALSASLIGSLFPASGGSFRLAPPDDMPREVAQSQDVKTWYEDTFTGGARGPFDSFEGGFHTVQEEYFNDQGAFGVSGIGAFDDYDSNDYPICFESIDAKRTWIAENKRGFVDTIYRVKIMTVHQMEQEYGLPNLASTLQDALNNDNRSILSEKKRVLIAIEPRSDRVHGKSGNDNYPIASVHIDLDHTAIMRESGYTDMPAFVTRFFKHKGETYGRSPAFAAMPDIMELNCTRQAAIVAVEKYLDPPLWTWENGILGGGTIDTSAGALIVAKMSVMQKGASPLNPLITTGELQYTYERMEEIESIIKDWFYDQELGELTSDQRMSVPEVNERTNRARQRMVGVFARQFTELYTPLIQRVVNILWLRNAFGYVKGSAEHIAYRLTFGTDPKLIPDVVVEYARSNRSFYKISFLSPAARIFSQDELNGISSLVRTVVDVGKIDPSVSDQMNWDRTFQAIHSLTGASANVLNSTEEIAQIRQSRQQQQQAAITMEAQERQALSSKHAAQAQEAQAKAFAAQYKEAA